MLTRLCPHLAIASLLLYPFRLSSGTPPYAGVGLFLTTPSGKSSLPRHRHFTRRSGALAGSGPRRDALVGEFGTTTPRSTTPGTP